MIGGRRTFLKRSYPYLLEDDGLIGNRANALQYVQVTESDVKIVSSDRMARKAYTILKSFPDLTDFERG